MVGGRGEGGEVSKLSQILGITTTIASFDTYEGSVKSVKCVQMVSLRRRLNEDGWGTGEKEEGGQSVKSIPNIENYLYYSL